MSRGYVVIAQNTKETDYIRQAYALALSIKNTQPTINNFCLCVSDINDIPSTYLDVFDDVVKIPWTDDAANSRWKVQNKWKYYYMTPYHESIVLDADMLFTDNIEHWWSMLSKRDMWFTTRVKTFRGETAKDDYYRETFRSNGLPNVYTAFFYFKKTKLPAEVFCLTNQIFKNWNDFYMEFLDNTRPMYLSGDVAFALALKILGYEHQCTGQIDIPTFVHMKSYIQNVPERFITESWNKHFMSNFSSNGEIEICNYRQRYPFHYHIDDWLSEEIIRKLENVYCTN